MMDKDELMKELIADEGFEYEIYLDHLDHHTLGVGHLITEKDEEYGQKAGTPISEQRIRECLDQDIATVCEELDINEPWWRGLSDNRQRVIANMCFNLGYPSFSGFKNFISAIQVSDWEKAAVEMMDSRWATQVGNRAVRLKERMLRG